VCGAALIARTMPDLLSVDHGVDSDRLRWPLTYWNGLGLMAALGILSAANAARFSKDSFVRRFHQEVEAATAAAANGSGPKAKLAQDARHHTSSRATNGHTPAGRKKVGTAC
jgi:hypothetical protein